MDPSEQGEGATAAEMLAPFAGYLHSNVEVSAVIPLQPPPSSGRQPEPPSTSAAGSKSQQSQAPAPR